MRVTRLVLLAGLLAVAAVPGAGALDIISEPKTLADGVVGQPYHHEFEGEEGCPPSYHFGVRSDSQLPPGLVLESDGDLVGTPAVPGDWNFWVHLTDGSGPGACNSVPSQADFNIRILPTLSIESNLLGTLSGRPVNTQLIGAGGGAPLIWSVSAGALPPGLTLSDKGVLAGATSAVGVYSFTVRLQDIGPKRVTTKQFTYVVANPLAATAPASRPAEVGRPSTVAATATGGIPPLRWSLGAGASLPTGLTLDGATGAITGTPTTAGAFALPLTVTDAEGNIASVAAALTVAPRLAIATARLPGLRVGRSFAASLRTQGGVAPVRWRIVGRLPRGLRLAASGRIVGTARVGGRARITVRATDALGVIATKTFTLQIRA
jgi:large repetitive protein